jgi:hypothetical protein
LSIPAYQARVHFNSDTAGELPVGHHLEVQKKAGNELRELIERIGRLRSGTNTPEIRSIRSQNSLPAFLHTLAVFL